MMVAYLATESRLLLVKKSESPSSQQQTSNLLQLLYNRGRAIEQKIRELVKKAFNKEIALDFSGLKKLELRIGDNFESLPLDPRDAKSVLVTYPRLDDQGDGLRSFTGIVTAMSSINRNLILIDEPEAFLHPPQAFRIGEYVAESAGPECQIIVATHSADFLRGILSKTHDTQIVRVSRTPHRNDKLNPDQLQHIATDPLLNSSRVFDGLFYAGAVIVEADSDARFYQLVSSKMNPGMDLHFVNADNKQTVPRIAKLYHQMGIPCAGVVDIDVLNEKNEFERQLLDFDLEPQSVILALKDQDLIASAVTKIPIDQRFAEIKSKLDELNKFVAENSEKIVDHSKLINQIAAKCRAISETSKPWKIIKLEGIDTISPEVTEAFHRIFNLCAKKGLFIVGTGELESMLKDYGLKPTFDKRNWIITALTLLPNLSPDRSKNPWNLMGKIHDYLTQNPD